MSKENVEGVRRGLEAYNRLDPDAFMEGATEDVEWFPAMGVAMGAGAFRGREGVERFMDEIRESWLEVEVTIEELRDLDDRVLVLGRQRGVHAAAALTSTRRSVRSSRFATGSFLVPARSSIRMQPSKPQGWRSRRCRRRTWRWARTLPGLESVRRFPSRADSRAEREVVVLAL